MTDITIALIEPVAWRWRSGFCGEKIQDDWTWLVSTVKPERSGEATDFQCEPLYAATELTTLLQRVEKAEAALKIMTSSRDGYQRQGSARIQEENRLRKLAEAAKAEAEMRLKAANEARKASWHDARAAERQRDELQARNAMLLENLKSKVEDNDRLRDALSAISDKASNGMSHGLSADFACEEILALARAARNAMGEQTE